MGLERLKQKSKAGNPTGEMSVLEKLLQIDRDLAIMMSLDMLMAGVDTVSFIITFQFLYFARVSFIFRHP